MVYQNHVITNKLETKIFPIRVSIRCKVHFLYILQRLAVAGTQANMRETKYFISYLPFLDKRVVVQLLSEELFLKSSQYGVNERRIKGGLQSAFGSKYVLPYL
jgi:hypothetical protein